MSRPSAKSLILDLLSSTRGRVLSAGALVRAGALFGIAENSIRVTLTRLVANGRIERDERARYHLAAKSAPVDDLVTSWRTVERNVRPWGGAWVAVHTTGLYGQDRGAARRRRHAVDYLGFQELRPGLWVRPDNLVGGVPAVRARLTSLGLDPQAPVFEASFPESHLEKEACRLWDTDALVARYRRLRDALSRSAARLPNLDLDRARRESFLIGGEAIRHIVLDPLLPEPLVPVAERRSLIEVMIHYDRLGRRFWAGALEGPESAQRHAPANVGSLSRDRAPGLAAAQGGTP